MLGKEGLSSETKSTHLLHIVGESLYSIGNYSESQQLLTKSLELVNEELQIEYSLKYKEIRWQICYYPILSGDFTNIFCYGYIIKDISSFLPTAIVHEFKERYTSGKIFKMKGGYKDGLKHQKGRNN